MLLGVHCSISGGYDNAFVEAHGLGIDTFQIFTKNQRQWRERIITSDEAISFRNNLQKYKIKKAFSHTSYLINIASADENIREKSVYSLILEVNRCQELGLAYTVLHPGSFRNTTIAKGIKNIIDGLNTVLELTAGSDVKILLENTAGQGSSIGGDFKHLGEIVEAVGSERIGLCFDTCHAFAAGHDIRTQQGFESTMAKIDKLIGIDKIMVFHLNDSKGDLGSHLDRHQHIGQGKLGLEPFKEIVNRFKNIPKVLETPKENAMDQINLETIRYLMV